MKTEKNITVAVIWESERSVFCDNTVKPLSCLSPRANVNMAKGKTAREFLKMALCDN